MDEFEGREVAAEHGIHATGAIGILLHAKEGGAVAAIKPLLDRLEKELRFRIGGELRKKVLAWAHEH